MPDLSVLIPSRNEMFLAQTVRDILEHSEADTEVIAVLDGPSAHEEPPEDERVQVISLPTAIGQRAATNLAAGMSEARFVMKADAHCAFAQGFDRVLLEDIQDGWTITPKMYNLHAFDWVCAACGQRRYQGRSGPCERCGGETAREVVWDAKHNPETTAMRFDRDLHFQYWSAYKARQSGDLVETMSLLGACWMLSRERYWELNICDEAHGSWGQQGTEVACKTWLSGGRLMLDKRTWFAHMFRTQGGDFGFPYVISGADVQKARAYSRQLWLMDGWPKAVHPLSWLIERFAPVPDWTEPEPAVNKPLPEPKARAIFNRQDGQALSKGIVYYTDNRLDARIMEACQRQILRATLPVVSVSLQPLEFGHNIVLEAERGVLTMFRQILAGIEASEADVLFLAEHDVLYHPTHFDFTPEDPDLFYYNEHVWKVRASDGHALFYWCNSQSGLCARRDLLLEHYRKRVALVEERGFSRAMGFEPGTHHRPERVDDHGHATWRSPWPNVDIRHDQTLTRSRWRKEEFRNQRYTDGWLEADEIPGWGRTAGRFAEFLDGIINIAGAGLEIEAPASLAV